MGHCLVRRDIPETIRRHNDELKWVVLIGIPIFEQIDRCDIGLGSDVIFQIFVAQCTTHGKQSLNSPASVGERDSPSTSSDVQFFGGEIGLVVGAHAVEPPTLSNEDCP